MPLPCSHLIFYPSFLPYILPPREVPERQPAEDRRQNQTTVLEPDDDRYQNQTTTVRTISQRTPRTIQSIDRSN